MKIKTSATPQWFFDSNMFQLETDNTNKNYNSPKHRVFDYTTFPTFTAPSNKITGHGEYDYGFMKAQENAGTRVDPGQQVGYNIYPKFKGLLDGQNAEFLNAYSPSQQIAFRNEGGNVNDNTLNMGVTNEAIQWINGEQGIGYELAGDTQLKINRLNTFLNNLKASNINTNNTKYGIYSLQAFPIWGQFYDLENVNTVNTLCAMLDNPPDSIQALSGFDYLMEDLYSIGTSRSQFYGAMGIFMKQLARKQYQLTNNEKYRKFYYLLWSHSEFFGFQFGYRKHTGEFISSGETDGLTKASSNINHNYNLALAGVTIGDGFFHFNDRFASFGTQLINGTNRDLELENVNHSINVTLRNQTYNIGPAILWLGVNQYATLAIWHAYLQKDIIEDTTHDWFTPDFTFNGILRTDKFKEIPYNLYYKEPTVQAKYSSDKTECLLYVCNFDTNSTSQEMVTIKIKNSTDDEVNVPVLLRGTKAELVRVTF